MFKKKQTNPPIPKPPLGLPEPEEEIELEEELEAEEEQIEKEIKAEEPKAPAATTPIPPIERIVYLSESEMLRQILIEVQTNRLLLDKINADISA